MWSLEGPALPTMLADAPVDADAKAAAAEVIEKHGYLQHVTSQNLYIRKLKTEEILPDG